MPSHRQKSFLVFCRWLWWSGRDITSCFISHLVGLWVLCQFLAVSVQFTYSWMDFSVALTNSHGSGLSNYLLPKGWEKNFLLFDLLSLLKSGVNKQSQKMTVNFFERQSGPLIGHQGPRTWKSLYKHKWLFLSNSQGEKAALRLVWPKRCNSKTMSMSNSRKRSWQDG